MANPATLENLFVVTCLLAALIAVAFSALSSRQSIDDHRIDAVSRYVESLEAELRELRANLEWEMGRELRHDVPHVKGDRHAL